MARVLVSFWLEEVLAVVAAKEEGEAVQVAAQSVQAVGGVAGVGQQRWRQRAGVGGASCDRRTAASRQAPRYDHHRGGGEPVHDLGSRTRAAGAPFLAGSQVPWGVDALGGEVSQPAWRAKPCWYLITTETG